jgi:hypothetical protein
MTMMFSTVKRYESDLIHLSSLTALQCDTFSRSTDAVFELSMRFAEPFKQSENMSDKEKAENERLMFLELTQGDDESFSSLCC